MWPQRLTVDIHVNRLKLQRRNHMAPIKNEILGDLGDILSALGFGAWSRDGVIAHSPVG